MTYLQLQDGIAGKWLTDTVFLFSEFPLDGVDVNNPILLRAQLFNITKAKFKHKQNITILNESDKHGLTAITATSEFSNLKIFGTDQILDKHHTLIFTNAEDYELISKDFIINTFRYIDGISASDQGNKRYRVTSLVKDLYEITLTADSEEDAVEKSKQYNISDWHHVEDYDSHLTEIVFLRAGRWGNIEAKEIGTE